MLMPRVFMVFFKNLKFRQKLFVSYLVVIIFPILVLGWYSYKQAGEYLLNEAVVNLEDSVGQIAENLNKVFYGYNKILSFLVNDDQVASILNNNTDDNPYSKYVNLSMIPTFFNTFLFTNEEIEQLTVYTSNTLISNRIPTVRSLDEIEEKPWYAYEMNSRKVNWLIEDGNLLGLYKYYKPFNGAPDNMLMVTMNSNKVFGFETANYKGFGAFIVDNEDKVIYVNTMRPNQTEVIAKIMKAKKSKLAIGGVKYAIVKKQISELDWSLYYYVPYSALSIHAKGIIVATLAIMLGCLLILIFITRIFTITFVSRIEKLNNKMKFVEEGHLEISVLSDSWDEIGELTNRFGKMLGNINSLIEEAYQNKIIQKHAEMRALQAQINPHFLYNTLSVINWKAIEMDAQEISEITTNMSTFYRTILNRGNNIITIQDELENIKSYIAIQLVMHDKSFEVEYEIDEKIIKYKMINIILQPIIENAIEHGIDQRCDNEGKLIITGTLEEDCSIRFTVRDNGPGMDSHMITQSLSKESKGYGLMNVDQRLKILFGEGYGLSISSELGRGTCVTVKIPLYTGE